ncbi:MAG: Stk1 family PASTA domain-containing Ser/Thr kinase [Eubacteriales bacterium]|nr:Stk1 family PASTA domain-containing Ser/Thr kinase [Eubacteriales bacterium]
MQPERTHISKGFIVDGRYEVVEGLGQGGMAYVYLAVDRSNGRKVALKVMREELSDDPEFIMRFATEARAAASLDHPNIVRVLDYGQDGDIRYIVQEYVAGTNLKTLIQEKGPLPWTLALPLMVQIALGLDHAHKRGIIHRDMKPQNVLITPDMTAKVTDFGIARASISNTITLTGGIAFGSVHYFSPEQARGSQVTERSDLYSLGLMLYEMLTGILPFDGDSSVAVAIKQLQDMPARPSKVNPQLNPALDSIIFKAIQKSPERRFQSAREFADELNFFMRDPQAYLMANPPQVQNWSDSSAALTTDRGTSNYGKIEDIERNLEKRRRSRVRDNILVALVVIVAVLGGVYLLANSLKDFSFIPLQTDSDQIVVERYVGENVADVEPRLREIYGDNYELEAVRSETQEKGVIFAQDPNYGTKLDPDEAFIKLRYSVGKSELALDDVSGLTEADAKSHLEKLGFNVSTRYEFSDSVESGKVSRTIPPAGATTYDGARVEIYVSKGSDLVTLPPMVGLPWTEAEKTLKNLGLNLRAQNAEGEDADDIPIPVRVVFSQDVDAGETLKQGNTILLEYSSKEFYESGGKSKAGKKGEAGAKVMPDLRGKTLEEMNRIMSAIWPSDAPGYYVSSIGRANSTSDPGVVVLEQTPAPGSPLDPYSTSVSIYMGYEN